MPRFRIPPVLPTYELSHQNAHLHIEHAEFTGPQGKCALSQIDIKALPDQLPQALLALRRLLQGEQTEHGDPSQVPEVVQWRP